MCRSAAFGGYLPSSALRHAANLYAQAGLKHILTQGDSLLTTLFTSLSSQGVYALASSYGSLLARLVFQPIEESSRGVFGRLLGQKPTPDDLQAAQSYLVKVLKAYALLSLQIVTVGPTLAPLLLRYIAGSRWAQTAAPRVLGLYCYYIPFLAFNGILEAFVSAVATTEQIRRQSAWMLAFSAGFAGAGFLFLHVYELGAAGLVAANAFNMTARIVWCGYFVRQYLSEQGTHIGIAQMLPGFTTVACSVASLAILNQLAKSFDGSIRDLAIALLVSAAYGLTS